MNTIFSKIKNNYNTSNGFTKLLYLNLSFFIIYTIIWVPQTVQVLKEGGITQIEQFINNYLAFSSSTNILLKRPWTLISYMFTHTNLFHILSNMICLYLGSKLFLKYFNSQQLIKTYILGGVFGAIFFKLIFNMFPEYFNAETPLIGGSAGISAIIIVICTYSPNFLIPIPLIGQIKLKHLGWITILFFYLGIGDNQNPGGNIAHLGGAIFGYIYTKQYKKNKNNITEISSLFKKIFQIFKSKKKVRNFHKRAKSDYEFNAEEARKQKEIDDILEKIAGSGYESLSKKEKKMLFNASKK